MQSIKSIFFFLLSTFLVFSCTQNSEFNCNNLVEKDGFWIIKNSMKKYSGSCSSYYLDGKKESSANYLNGLLNGKVKFFRLGGTLKEVLIYKMGIQNGQVKYYFSNGAIELIGNVINNKQEGKWLYFYENGKTKASIIFKNNKENDSIIEYYKTGKIKLKGYFVNGMKEGKWIFYDSITNIKEGFLEYKKGITIKRGNE